MKIEERLIPINEFTRPGREMVEVKAVVVHWTAWPGGTNDQVYTLFATGNPKSNRYGSTHYTVDEDGILKMIPETEIAYHVGAKTYTEFAIRKFDGRYPNNFSVGIEMCHADWSGEFSEEVLEKSSLLVADICKRYGLNPDEDVIRHYDVTGKNCPKHFVENEAAFMEFKNRVKREMR